MKFRTFILAALLAILALDIAILLPVNTPLAQSSAGGSGGGGGSGGAVTQSGNWNVGQAGTWTFGLSSAIPAGSNAIGSVSVSNLPATQAVSGTFWQATQPVSVSTLPLPSGAATSAGQNVTNAGTSATQAQAVQGVTGGVPQNVAGTFWQATQPVSAAALPLPSGAATAANQSTEISSLGAPADTAYGGSGSSSIIAALKGLYTAMIAPTPTGGNVIGSTTLRSAGVYRSSNVTTTASTLMAANTSRQGWKLKNDCTIAVWINFDGTAVATAGSGNIQLPPGGYMASEPGFVETGAMSVITGSGSCLLTGREH